MTPKSGSGPKQYVLANSYVLETHTGSDPPSIPSSSVKLRLCPRRQHPAQWSDRSSRTAGGFVLSRTTTALLM
jgi:hypothetical protein